MRPYKYTHEKARENVAFLVRNGKKIVFRPDEKLPTLPKPIHVPHDMTFVNRLQWGLASVLAGLSARRIGVGSPNRGFEVRSTPPP